MGRHARQLGTARQRAVPRPVPGLWCAGARAQGSPVTTGTTERAHVHGAHRQGGPAGPRGDRDRLLPADSTGRRGGRGRDRCAERYRSGRGPDTASPELGPTRPVRPHAPVDHEPADVRADRDAVAPHRRDDRAERLLPAGVAPPRAHRHPRRRAGTLHAGRSPRARAADRRAHHARRRHRHQHARGGRARHRRDDRRRPRARAAPRPHPGRRRRPHGLRLGQPDRRSGGLPRRGRGGDAALPRLRCGHLPVAAGTPAHPQPRRRHAQHRPRRLHDLRHPPAAHRRRPLRAGEPRPPRSHPTDGRDDRGRPHPVRGGFGRSRRVFASW
jgi:hypothetical protein